jgi:hypothetical protein
MTDTSRIPYTAYPTVYIGKYGLVVDILLLMSA